MSRYVSFIVLIAVILILGILFYRVMASFILPLFLATVLVVVFGPVHKWMLEKTANRRSLAAALTTGIIGLAVILPVGGIGLFAFGEARQLFKSLTSGGLEHNLKRVRKGLNLEMPAPAEFRKLEKSIRALDVRNLDELDLAEKQLGRIYEAADRLELELQLPRRQSKQQGLTDKPLITELDIERWGEFRNAVRNARELRLQLQAMDMVSISSSVESDMQNSEPGASELGVSGPEDSSADPDETSGKQLFGNSSREEIEISFRAALQETVESFDHFRVQALGGSMRAYFKEVANPSNEEFEKYNSSVISWIRDNFLSLGGKASQFVFRLIFNALIMMIGVYFFLVDGPKMIAAVKFFSPLDDRHEEQLINEFGIVCRAVMVATLTAAAVQAVLAGIGYYFAGVHAVFLLTMLTGLLAMVPFVGAGAVWFPTCVYLYLIEDRLVPALLLAVWGAGVVSTIDNVIKPYILHGQSNIHPLLALLSVLGGVSALGPIGILVGPMVVAFLHTLLTILRREISELDGSTDEQEDVAGEAESDSVTRDTSRKVVDDASQDKGHSDSKRDSSNGSSSETTAEDSK